MVKLFNILLVIISPSLTLYSQEQIYENNEIKSIYHLTEGRIDGNYTSYYKNGIKKSEGSFENNIRSGKWIVWDSTGTIRMERNYSNPFAFKRIIPTVPTDSPIDLLNIPQCNVEYNNEGYVNYCPLKESDVLFQKRLWRFLSPKNNSILFDENKLFNFFNRLILDSSIKAYKATDDNFKTEFIPSINPQTDELIGFKIKEDFFFDMNRLVSETRIIGICPVIININTKDTLDLYWIYFPEVRKYLAESKVEEQNIPKEIKTLDDLFFYRFFSGKIYKEAGVLSKINFEEAERIEIELIEKEHEIWLDLTRSIIKE